MNSDTNSSSQPTKTASQPAISPDEFIDTVTTADRNVIHANITLAAVLAVLSIVFCWLPVLGLPFAVASALEIPRGTTKGFAGNFIRLLALVGCLLSSFFAIMYVIKVKS